MLFRRLVALVAAGVPVLAQVIPVSGGGAALANAIAAAPPDAVLVVAQNTYSSVSLTVSKNVTIFAPQGATVIGDFNLSMTGPYLLRVAGINLNFLTPGNFITNGNLHAELCNGGGLSVGTSAARRTVYARGCNFGGNYGRNVLTNVDAVLVDCLFSGGHQSSQNIGYGSPGLTVSGSLRAERTQAYGASGQYGAGYGIEVTGPATLVDCVLGGANHQWGWATPLQNNGPTTQWNCTFYIIPPANPYTTRMVPTAQFTTTQWSVGGTSTVLFREAANTPVAVVLAADVVPWTSPLALEQLWVFATPNWSVTTVLVTDAQGRASATVPLPNVPALQYMSLWTTGVFFAPLPGRTTCPLGGLVR